MFSDSMVTFAAGGGAIRWAIDYLAENILENSKLNMKLVLLPNYGGATEALANDASWVAKHREIEQSIGKSYLHIVDSDANPGAYRQLLGQTNRLSKELS